jgi:hypothetical protein
MLEVRMEERTTTGAVPGKAEWTELVNRMEDAKRLVSTDPLLAIAQLGEATDDVGDAVDELMKYAVMEARDKGYTWREIAAVTGVAHQAAWRRWTDKGIPKTRKSSGPELT